MQYNSWLNKSVQILFLMFLVFAGLYFARPFLIPIVLAGIISMLLLPLNKKLSARGLNKPLSAGISILLLLLLISAVISLLTWQISGIAQDFSQMKDRISQLIGQVQSFLDYKLGITREQQKELLKSSGTSGKSEMSKLLSGTMSFLVNFVLVVVYIFILLCYRTHLKKFVLKVVPPASTDRTEKVIQEVTLVSYKYLSGLTTMIVMLWVLYGIGFSIIGIKNALFFAVLCGVLEIVPFVGNLTGTSITVLMALTQADGGPGMALGVLCTYLFVQFIQSYVIEPLVVGAEVDINPLFTIIALVLGEMLWGIAGLILAIPLIGMLKIVCDNIEALRPFGQLIGDKKEKGNQGFREKSLAFFRRIKS